MTITQTATGLRPSNAALVNRLQHQRLVGAFAQHNRGDCQY